MSGKAPVQFRRPYTEDSGDLVYDSKCGRFTIYRRNVMDVGSSRAGSWSKREYELYFEKNGKGVVETYETLRDAKWGACCEVDPHWEAA